MSRFFSCLVSVFSSKFAQKERSWGEGVRDTGWRAVGDTSLNWSLLWQENEYLWKPIINPAPPSNWVTEVHVAGTINGVSNGIADGIASNSVYGSGGWSGAGGIKTNDSGSSSYWPCAYGTPTKTGEQSISMSVRISPSGAGTVLNGETSVVMKNTAPSTNQKRVGVTGVASVSWEQIDGTANKIKLTNDNPTANGGGQRCFPETDINGHWNDTIDVKVSLVSAVPAGMIGNVYIAWFDPKNPIGSTKSWSVGPGIANTSQDNHGTISLTSALTFSAYTDMQHLSKSVMFTIPVHAGDNYIVTAHPRSGIQGNWRFKADGKTLEYRVGDGTIWKTLGYDDAPLHHQTSMLTVWRTLWAERDRMTFTFPSGSVQTADLPLIDGFVKSEFARACIDLKEYLPNPNTIVVGEEIRPVWSTAVKNQYSAVRDSPGPTKTFWTVQMVGSFRHAGGAFGTHAENMVFVYNWAIKNAVNEWNTNNPNQQVTSLDDSKRRNSLHELGHVFGLKDNVYSTGVMAYKNMYERLLPENKEFKLGEIQTIQSQSKPQ